MEVIENMDSQHVSIVIPNTEVLYSKTWALCFNDWCGVSLEWFDHDRDLKR